MATVMYLTYQLCCLRNESDTRLSCRELLGEYHMRTILTRVVASCLKGCGQVTLISTQHIEHLGVCPQEIVFKLYAQRSFLKPNEGQKFPIIYNSWQAGFWELLHVYTEVASDRTTSSDHTTISDLRLCVT